MAESTVRRLEIAGLIVVLMVVLFGSGCVLPARVASGVTGSVVDAESGEPLEGAVVVVRFDGRRGDVLPERELLGYREATSNPNGNFEVGKIVRPGLATWPEYKTDARIAAVIMPGYRCARPRPVAPGSDLTIELEPAQGLDDQRESCRPIPADRGQADAYMAAWRGLFPNEMKAADIEAERQISRVLEARSVFGFGENCAGPVTDLALAADGSLAGVSITSQPVEVRLIDLSRGSNRGVQVVGQDTHWPTRRLAWTNAGNLVLWEPMNQRRRSISPSAFGADRFEVVYRSGVGTSVPAKPDFGPKQVLRDSRRNHTPLDPADLNDEADTRWNGRGFALKRSLDPRSGLATDHLEISRPNGTRYEIELPGEACGPDDRFGRPQYRISEDGRTAIDLRFVNGGCHAIAIDLETADFSKIDGGGGGATCSHVRDVPASQLNTALRNYTREVLAARVAAGGDPSAAYAIIMDPSGKTRIETRSHSGEPVVASAPNFPIQTPLRRINVSLIGGSFKSPKGGAPARPLNDLNPL